MSGRRARAAFPRQTAAHVVAVVTALYVPVAALAPHGLAPLLIISALALVVAPPDRRALRSAWRTPLALLFAAVVVVGAASALWAIKPEEALVRAAKLAGLFVAVVVFVTGTRSLEPRQARRVESALVGGLAVGLALLVLEAITDGALSQLGRTLLGDDRPWSLVRLSRGVGTAAVLLWPALLILWRRGRRGAALAVGLVAVVAVFGSASLAARIALVAGAGMAALVLLAGPRATTAFTFVLVVGITVAPLLPATVLTPERINAALPAIKESGLHRGYIWQFSSRRIAEKPLAGWGLDASRYIPGGDRRVPQSLRELPEEYRLMSLHPHNWPLQAWLELGAPGAVLLAALAIVVRAAIRRLADDRTTGAMAAAAFVSATVFALLSWGLWQSWWIAGLGMAGGLLGLAARPPPTS